MDTDLERERHGDVEMRVNGRNMRMKASELETETQRREERRHGRDCVTQMQMLRVRPDWLAGALREMGIGEGDDEVTEEERE